MAVFSSEEKHLETGTEKETPSLFKRISRRLREGTSGAADLLLPPLCLGCRAPLISHDALCVTCWQGIDFIRQPLCDRLGLPMPFDPGGGRLISAAAAAAPPDYDRARAVAHYGGTMRTLVHALKFEDRQELRRLLGRLLHEAGRELLTDADLIVPVPLSRWRLFSRRFNQAALLGGELARLTALPHAPLVLQRTKRTKSQVGLTRRQRRENMAGAFAVEQRRKAKISGRRVLLIDDVVTTGATVSACARALKRAGAIRVDVLALALVADAAHIPA